MLLLGSLALHVGAVVDGGVVRVGAHDFAHVYAGAAATPC